MSPFPLDLKPAPGVLLDERTRPDFRDVFGSLARHATEVSTAVTRVRLTTLDLSASELAGLVRFRVLVAELSALRLDRQARVLHTEPGRVQSVRRLLDMLENGTLFVRSAPLGGWSPDFSVFLRDGSPEAVLAGFHAFERPYPHRGPALAALHGPPGATLAQQRFDETWNAAHDVGPALWSTLCRAMERAG